MLKNKATEIIHLVQTSGCFEEMFSNSIYKIQFGFHASFLLSSIMRKHRGIAMWNNRCLGIYCKSPCLVYAMTYGKKCKPFKCKNDLKITTLH